MYDRANPISIYSTSTSTSNIFLLVRAGMPGREVPRRSHRECVGNGMDCGDQERRLKEMYNTAVECDGEERQRKGGREGGIRESSTFLPLCYIVEH